MRAMGIIRNRLESEMGSMHAARRNALWRAVESLLTGGKLWLSALGRSMPGATSHKSSIKAIDRLLGNALLFAELGLVYHQLAALLLRNCWRPIVLVDETEIRPGVLALTASLALDGRGVPLYAIVRSKKYISTRKCRANFLKRLAAILPEGVIPTLVTDAGFESPWFDEVEARGWDYVGRVRHKTRFFYKGAWVGAQQLHRGAGQRAKNLGMLSFPRCRPKSRRLVLAKARKSKGRKRLTTRRKSSRTNDDRRCEKSAREPWLLATSLSPTAEVIVSIYATRMQIEQNYRDTKNHRWGWCFDQNGSRRYERLEILLMISALATIVQLSVGCAGERKQLHHSFQANTIRDRRVISLFVLGHFLLRQKAQHLLALHEIRAGFAEFLAKIQSVEGIGN